MKQLRGKEMSNIVFRHTCLSINDVCMFLKNMEKINHKVFKDIYEI